ncbi:MAG: HAMP domain-containing histidine kinase [Thermoflexales bacterium]|nr:HAMP domain-containing histidine kinase [Thermoflexales bacterium]
METITPEAVELSRQLRQHLVLRWWAIMGILAAVAVARLAFTIGVAWGPVLAVTAIIAGYNLAFAWWARRLERLSQYAREFASVQIVADLLALTALLHFTGGIENPFFLFYFIHIGLGSVLLPARDIYRVTALAIGMFAGLAVGEYAAWLPHFHLAGFLPAGVELSRHLAYVAAGLGAFAITLSLVAVAATRVTAELHRRRAEQAAARQHELEQARNRLAELDRMRTFFLALASHDLKTPLAVAINYIYAILGGYAGQVAPNQQRWLERSVARLQELVQLIDDFLDVSQLDEARIHQEMQPVDLVEIMRLAVDHVSSRARDKDIRLCVSVPDGPLLIQGSPKRLRCMVSNLLDNGIKFTPDGGQVELVLMAESDGVRIEVSDTGVGIPAQHLPHVFEDYFRVRRDEFVPGAGLGLCTARRIVEAHGGQIWAQSPYCAEHSGSKFVCRLSRIEKQDASDE